MYTAALQQLRALLSAIDATVWGALPRALQGTLVELVLASASAETMACVLPTVPELLPLKVRQLTWQLHEALDLLAR